MAANSGLDIIQNVYQGNTLVRSGYHGASLVYTTGGAPVITSFTVTPNRINRATFRTGDEIVFAWEYDDSVNVTEQTIWETTADGTRNQISISTRARSFRHSRPNQSTTYSLYATNANGTTIANVTVEIVANVNISYFRVRAGSFSQAPQPNGLVIGTITLEWQVSGEPFPNISLSGAGASNFDSSISPHRDHTDHSTGIGSRRISRAISQAASRTYTLRASSEVNTVTATTTYQWPAGNRG